MASKELLKAPPTSMMVRFLVIGQIISVSLLVPFAHSTLIGDHICYRNESFTELEQRRSTEPVRIREYGWCLGFPPRCSKYRTETKEIVKYQNVTKHRSITECCDGFVPSPVTGNEDITKCLPTCPNGCENGVCSEPNKCECFIGYEGVTCIKTCDKGTWGLKCSQTCNCPSFSCDPVSGVCIECLEGWTGHGCNTKCPKSFYGRDCKNRCDSCPEQDCDFKSGECLLKPTTTTTTTTTIRTSPSPTTTEASTTTIATPTPSFPPPPTSTTNHLFHIHKIDAKSTTNSMAINVLNTSISSLTTNVKNLERQVDEHKRLISTSTTTTTTSTTPFDLTIIGLSTTGSLSATGDSAAAVAAAGGVIFSAHPGEVGEGGEHLVEVPLDASEVVVQLDHNHNHNYNHNHNHNLQDPGSGGGGNRTTKIEDKVERHASILIALIAVLCVVACGCIGYFCLRRRCFIFPMKSGKVQPHATELNDVKTMDKPLPAIPATVHEEPHRMRSGSVKSVTFDEKLTYYGDGPGADKRPSEGTFEHHFYDEVKYPPTLSNHKII